MRIVLVGPGRAGMALALAITRAGHEIVAVVGRTAESAARGAALVDARPLTPVEVLPESDLALIATRDAAIGAVAAALVPVAGAVGSVAHVSGLTPVARLRPLADAGHRIGSFHPLQTLPSPEAGAARLPGAWIAVTAEEPLRSQLFDLAGSIGAFPFVLEDAAKPLYHAAAAAAANFPLVALTMAADLFSGSGVPWEAARPLVEAVIANTFELGPRASLTGPVARGDTATVRKQLEAVGAAAPEWSVTFARFVESLAGLVGRTEEFVPVLAHEQEGE